MLMFRRSGQNKQTAASRFCIDYRGLNEVTRKDAYPLPSIDVTVDALHGSQYFSTLDLVSGYWQVEVEESDREKTALRACISSESCPLGSVMPLRLFSDSWTWC